jgi:hypothetical protein
MTPAWPAEQAADVRDGSLATGVVSVARPRASALPRKRKQNQSIGHDEPLRVDGVALRVIQAPKLESRIMRYEFSDFGWAAIKPMLPNKPHGVPRVNDRRVLAETKPEEANLL